MRARPTGLAVAFITTAVSAGIAQAPSSYPCTETNANLPNPPAVPPDPKMQPQ